MTVNPPQNPIGWLAVASLLGGLLAGLGLPMLGLAFWLGQVASDVDDAQDIAKANARAVQSLLIVTERLSKGLDINEREVDRLRQQQESRIGPR